jgi:ATP-binding cassette subfamily F protein 3
VADADLRGLLGCFLFTGDDVYKPLGVLSGGERNRYALAKILVSPANFLLLDEPTNHLDMRAKDVLLHAVKHFEGTVIFVSHDRYFIDGTATRVFEVEDGHVHVYPGNYEDYLYRKSAEATRASATLGNGATVEQRGAPIAAVPVAAVAEEGAAEAATRTKKLNPIKLRQMQDRLQFVEEELPRCEAAIAVTETAMANYVSADETQRLAAELRQRRDEAAELSAEWEELVLALEEQGVLM